MTKKLVWRLKEQPTSKMLQELVLSGILTKEEAREILFSSETEKDRDKKSLESEIKFLRELVEKLSEGKNSRIVEVIKEIEIPIYRKWDWYQPYSYWCSSGASNYTTGDTGGTTDEHLSGTPLYGTIGLMANITNFSNIKTF